MDSKEKNRIIAELREEQAKGVRNKPWTKDEIDVLSMFYGKVQISTIAKKLNRTVGAVHNAADRLVKK